VSTIVVTQAKLHLSMRVFGFTPAVSCL